MIPLNRTHTLTVIGLIVCVFTNISFAQWTTSGSNIYNTDTGNVGIGTTNPYTKLHITGGGITIGANVFGATPDGHLSIGDVLNSSTPTMANAVDQTTMILNAKDYSTIGFHHVNNRMDFIRVGNGTIDLGYNGGWGRAHIGFANGIWDADGKVGVGTTTPETTFHAHGSEILSTGPAAGIKFRDRLAIPRPANQTYLDDWVWYTVGKVARFNFGGAGDLMVIESTGNVGIGTGAPGNYRLSVEGKIGAREVEVKTGSWADFVFQPDYHLRPLSEVASYVATYHHLPEIPSEAEVKEKGISLGEMNAKLLQKIEELTLYSIELEKQNKQLKDRQIQDKVELTKEINQLKEFVKQYMVK